MGAYLRNTNSRNVGENKSRNTQVTKTERGKSKNSRERDERIRTRGSIGTNLGDLFKGMTFPE